MVKTKKVSKLKDDSKWAWLMLAPNIIGFLLFMLIPMVATFVLSFTKYDMLSTPKFVGLQNYIDMAKDPIIWEVTKNTILYTVITVPVGMCISLLLAVMLDQKIAFRRFYRAHSSFRRHFHASCSDRMAVDLQSGLWPFELFSVSVRD